MGNFKYLKAYITNPSEINIGKYTSLDANGCVGIDKIKELYNNDNTRTY